MSLDIYGWPIVNFYQLVLQETLLNIFFYQFHVVAQLLHIPIRKLITNHLERGL